MDDNVKYPQKYHLINGEVYTRRPVHKFSVGDVDEVDLYSAHGIHNWLENTEQGQFVKKHGKDITYETFIEAHTFGYNVLISAMISDRHWTMYMLKYAS